PRIGIGIVVDDTPALLRLIRLGPDVVRYPRVGRLGPLTGCLVRGRCGVLIDRLLTVGRMQAPAESAQPQKKGQGDSHASEMRSHELRVLKERAGRTKCLDSED